MAYLVINHLTYDRYLLKYLILKVQLEIHSREHCQIVTLLLETKEDLIFHVNNLISNVMSGLNFPEKLETSSETVTYLNWTSNL